MRRSPGWYPDRRGRPDPRPQPDPDPAPKPKPIDYDRLAGEVLRRLPPIEVHLLDGNGDSYDVQTVPLGGRANIPPARMRIYHPDGEAYDQAKPLGEPITLELVPIKATP